MNTIHVLKTVAHYWDAVKRGDKTFEVRRNDRAFQTGDVLVLRRTNEAGRSDPAPGDQLHSDQSFRVTYLLQGGQFGIEPAFCVMGIEPIKAET